MCDEFYVYLSGQIFFILYYTHHEGKTIGRNLTVFLKNDKKVS